MKIQKHEKDRRRNEEGRRKREKNTEVTNGLTDGTSKKGCTRRETKLPRQKRVREKKKKRRTESGGREN